MTGDQLNLHIRDLMGTAMNSFMVNDYDEALKSLKAAEVIDSQNPQVLYNIAVCYGRMGLHKSAVDYCVKTLSLPQKSVDLLRVKKMQVFSLLNLGRNGDAKKILNELIILNGSDIPSLSMLAYCLEKGGSIKDAVDVYKKILSIDPGNSTALNSGAYLTAVTGGDLKAALKMAAAALKADRNNPAYLDTIGFILMKSGDYVRAETAFNKAFEMIPAEKELRDHIIELEQLIEKQSR